MEKAATMKNAVLRVVDTEAKAWVVGILGLVLLQLLVSTLFLGSKRKLTLPPGPRNLPFIGAVFSLESNLAHCFTKLARKFGPIIYYRLGSQNVVVVSSVQGAEEVLKTKDSQFADRPNTTIMRTVAKYLAFNTQDIVLANYSDDWKKLKNACVNSLLVPSKLAAFENVRRHEGAFMVEQISNRGAGNGAGSRINVNIRETLSTVSSNNMCMLIFRKRYSDAILSEKAGFRHFPYLVRRSTELALQFNLVDLFPWLGWTSYITLEAQCKEFHKLCSDCFGESIEEHRLARKSEKNYEDRDFVDLLLTLHESGEITEDGILGCLVDFVIAGIDTNSTNAEWAMLELVKNPETLAKLQKEIDEVVGRDRPIEESDFASMPYLQAVIKETFRLHASTPLLVPHFTKTESSLGGFYVPPNTTVFVNMYAMSRDPVLWENPEQFNPSRFLGSRHSNVKNLTGSAFEILPFGRGRRMCPGYSLGLLLVQRAITSLVHAFDWSPPAGVGVDGVSAVEEMGIVCRPEVPLVLSATPRLAPTVYSTQ